MGQAASQPAAPVVSNTHLPTYASSPAQCPIKHESVAPTPSTSSADPARCPVDHSKHAASSSAAPAQCPISHDNGAINPLNQMPTLSQAPSVNQEIALPIERSTSSIPRDDAGNWEYPSPQQFYNALVRKGWETPEEHVEMMVQIHNFLNERAWLEILKWERKENPVEDLQLARFKGRPGELSPKARFWLFAGWLLPTRFNTEPPFDRHDWVVKRRSTGEEVRYVIDYYSAPPEPDGSPVFSLDVRPALDSFGSVKQRIAAATEDVWTSFKDDSNAGIARGA